MRGVKQHHKTRLLLLLLQHTSLVPGLATSWRERDNYSVVRPMGKK